MKGSTSLLQFSPVPSPQVRASVGLDRCTYMITVSAPLFSGWKMPSPVFLHSQKTCPYRLQPTYLPSTLPPGPCLGGPRPLHLHDHRLGPNLFSSWKMPPPIFFTVKRLALIAFSPLTPPLPSR
jgi:hypothetical protein